MNARNLTLLAGLLFCLAPFGLAEPATPLELLATGNQAYEEERWEDAETAFQAIAGQGVFNETAYYNLGCSHARQGELGPAVLAFRRALFFDPAHEDARANLEFLRARLADAPGGELSFLQHLARWSAMVPLRAGLLAGLLLEWLAAILIAWALLGGRETRRRQRLLRAGITIACVALLVAILPATRLALRAMDDGAVILESRAEARSGPGETNPVLFTVHEGYELEAGNTRRGWTRISTTDSLAGWVPSTALAPVNPAHAPLATR